MKTIRIILLIFVSLMISAISFAQTDYAHLEAVLDVYGPQPLPKSLNKKDLNGDPASVLLVSSPLTGLLFEGNVLDVTETQDIAEDSNLYYVYITKGTKRLTIKHRLYVQTQFEFPKTVDSKQLWNMTVTGIEAPKTSLVEIQDIDNKHNVNIVVEPWVELYIDEILSKDVKSLEEGVHYISAQSGVYKYSQKVNIQREGQEIDARLGGEVIVKNARQLSITPNLSYKKILSEPQPNLIYNFGNKYMYDGMLGNYIIEGKPSTISARTFKQKIAVASRSHKTIDFDITVPYAFIMYHATYQQYLGLELARCKRFGWFASVCYGNDDGSSMEETVMTISTGPMFRLYRKLYMQVGAGLVYLDGEYDGEISVNADLIYRVKSFAIGLGYKRLFADYIEDYAKIKNQISLSIGFAFGL